MGYVLAVVATVLLLFFGSGWEEVLTAIRLPSLIAVASGLGALLALGRRELLWDVVATALLCVGVASHPTGVAFTAAAAVMVILSPAPEQWKRVWVVLVPAAIFVAWYLIWRTTTPTAVPEHRLRRLSVRPRVVGDALRNSSPASPASFPSPCTANPSREVVGARCSLLCWRR